MRLIAAKALAHGQPEDSDEVKKWTAIENQKMGSARQILGKHAKFNNKMAYQLVYNAFQSYLAALIKQIYNRQKNMLNLKDKVSFKEIIQFSRMNDLTSYLIDKRINDLTFQSIQDLNLDFYEKYGFKFFETQLRTQTISRIAQRRNLLVHNNGIVNHGFIERTGDRRSKVGQHVKLCLATTLIEYLQEVAVDIDRRARTKFGLAAVSLKGKKNQDD